jgi:hypothetical protein
MNKVIIALIISCTSCASFSNQLTKSQSSKWLRCSNRIAVEQCGVSPMENPSIYAAMCVSDLANKYYSNPSDEWLLEHGCPDYMVGKR